MFFLLELTISWTNSVDPFTTSLGKNFQQTEGAQIFWKADQAIEEEVFLVRVEGL